MTDPMWVTPRETLPVAPSSLRCPGRSSIHGNLERLWRSRDAASFALHDV